MVERNLGILDVGFWAENKDSCAKLGGLGRMGRGNFVTNVHVFRKRGVKDVKKC